MNSKRIDSRGHWPAGKPRSPLSAMEVSAALAKLNRALTDQSMRSVARILGIADTQVRRIVRGIHLPSQNTAAKIRERL